MTSEDARDKWSGYWRSGFTPWLRNEPNPWLWKYIDLLQPNAKEEKNGDILLVPCCSKVRDLKILHDKGFQVVGVECHEPAVKEFFKEHDLEFVTRDEPRIEGSCTEYSSADGGLRILVTDFLKVTPEVIGGPVKMVWDRGSLGSIEKKYRKSYIKTMFSLLNPEFRYFLDCFHYDDWYTEGPPRNFPRKLVEEIFGEKCNIMLLDKTEEHLHSILDVVVQRYFYLITTKPK